MNEIEALHHLLNMLLHYNSIVPSDDDLSYPKIDNIEEIVTNLANRLIDSVAKNSY